MRRQKTLELIATRTFALIAFEGCLRFYALKEFAHCDGNILGQFCPDAERRALIEARLPLAIGELFYIKVFRWYFRRSRKLQRTFPSGAELKRK